MIRNSYYRSECPDQRGLRLHGINLLAQFLAHRSECPDQRGLRLRRVADIHAPSLIEANAPIRGDCDDIHAHDRLSTVYRSECPDQRGLRLLVRLNCRSILSSKRMPRSEGIATYILPCSIQDVPIEANAPIRGDCDFNICFGLDPAVTSKRMPRSEGIATPSPLEQAESQDASKRMPRSEGIATAYRSNLIFYICIEANAPIRGDCDQNTILPP